jgi:hypothetical protein
MFNEYDMKARIFPAILCTIPVLVFQYYFFSQEVLIFLQYLGNLQFSGNITISIVLIYFVSQLNIIISKTFFQKDESYMPTTNILLFSDSEYSREYKQVIYKRLQDEFNLQLPTKKDQNENELNARKRIAEIMSLARKRIGSGKLLLNHNIIYGFWRNFIGGTPISILISGLGIYFSYLQSNETALMISILLFLIYSIILFLNKFIIDNVGKSYANVLIQEYMER